MGGLAVDIRLVRRRVMLASATELRLVTCLGLGDILVLAAPLPSLVILSSVRGVCSFFHRSYLVQGRLELYMFTADWFIFRFLLFLLFLNFFSFQTPSLPR